MPEELLTHVTTVNGEPPKALIRAEIVYFETIGAGAVFSTGSITFCGSLSHNNYENSVSRMLEMCCAGSTPNNRDTPAGNGPVLDADR